MNRPFTRILSLLVATLAVQGAGIVGPSPQRAVSGNGWSFAFTLAQDFGSKSLAGGIAMGETPSRDGRARLVVVTPERFKRDLQPFADYRRSDLEVEIATLEEILKTNPGVDDPEKLKRALYGAWKERHARYVLLVGDASVLPVRYMVLDRITPAAFDYAFYPSDLYYADVAKPDGSFDDWNACKEGFHAGYYGEVRGEKNKADPINFDHVDYCPELAVGRWPVNSSGQLRTIAAKTIATQRRLRAMPNEGRRAAFVAVGGWVDSRAEMDRMAAFFPSNWAIEKRYDSPDRKQTTARPPDEPELLGLLNGGVDLMFHAGHGTDTCWERCLFMNHLGHVHNASRLPVMISAGCSTARFATLPPYEGYLDVHGVEHKGTDRGEVFKAPPPPPSPYQTGRFNPPGLGKQLLVAGPDGAVAYIGCNTGSQPCGRTLLEGFAKAWGQGKESRLGDYWAEAVRYYFEKERLSHLKPTADWYPPSVFFQGMKFMLYGDPSLRLRP